MNSFDNVAKTWDKEKKTLKRIEYVSKQIRSLCRKKGKALDFGAGTGILGMELEDLFSTVSFFDTSKMMVEEIKNKIGENNKFSILTEVEGSFDVIFNSMVMHHIDNHKEISNIFYKVLENEGELFIHDLEPEDGSFHNGSDYDGHYGINKENFRKLLLESGFSSVEFYKSFDVEKNNTVYPTFMIKAVK